MNYDKLHVLAVISNPVGYESRYKLHGIFEEDIERKGAQLWTVEMQTGARVHRITDQNNPRHLQVWSSALPGEFWHKENLINLGIQNILRHAPDARYIAWVDADVKFEPGALEKTVEALQHWDVVQMWSHAIDFCPDGGVLANRVTQSFMYCHWKGINVEDRSGYLAGGHPGYAWAVRRDALNRLGSALSGPLIDFAALGSGDRHMACGLIGQINQSHHGDVHPNYKKWLLHWQDQAERNLKHNVGYVANTLRHLWHGRKADRGYASRWKVLVKHQYNPETDIAKDSSGLWRLVVNDARQMALRDDIRRYFRARKEDATTL